MPIAWLPGDQVADLAAATPQFWTGQGITWSILARVDGTLYSLFGDPPQSSGVKPAITNSADYTSTHTIFGLTAGDADLTLDFMTPVPPDELRSSESTDELCDDLRLWQCRHRPKRPGLNGHRQLLDQSAQH